jgi:hypothetical protein
VDEGKMEVKGKKESNRKITEREAENVEAVGIKGKKRRNNIKKEMDGMEVVTRRWMRKARWREKESRRERKSREI